MADDLAPLAPERPSSSSSVEEEGTGKRQRVTRQPLLGTSRVDLSSMEDAITYLTASGASSQADGCLALAKLLRHNVLPGVARSAAVKQGAIDLLVTALRTHPHDTAVQARASLRRMP